jgi:hypothetical protein
LQVFGNALLKRERLEATPYQIDQLQSMNADRDGIYRCDDLELTKKEYKDLIMEFNEIETGIEKGIRALQLFFPEIEEEVLNTADYF